MECGFRLLKRVGTMLFLMECGFRLLKRVETMLFLTECGFHPQAGVAVIVYGYTHKKEGIS